MTESSPSTATVVEELKRCNQVE